MIGGLCLMCTALAGCGTPTAQRADNSSSEGKNAVVENIMSRRSIRKYKPQAVSRETMQAILECGINAPNGQNKQSWEVRVVDNPALLDSLKAQNPGLKKMLYDAPTIAFIANDLSYDFSQVDCGLLAGNMMLSAWSMGVGSVCLGGPVRLLNTEPAAAGFLKKLDFPEGYRLLICIAFGYPDEAPAAKPRNAGKVRFID